MYYCIFDINNYRILELEINIKLKFFLYDTQITSSCLNFPII